MIRDLLSTLWAALRLVSTRSGRATFRMMRDDPDQWMAEQRRKILAEAASEFRRDCRLGYAKCPRSSACAPGHCQGTAA